jgi:hypothetical protein
MCAQVDPDFPHHQSRVFVDPPGMLTSAVDLKAPARISAHQRFSHLAAGRVTGT